MVGCHHIRPSLAPASIAGTSSKRILMVATACYAEMSTDWLALDRALGGARPQLCLTDPPYGIGEAYVSHDDSRENLAGLVERFLPLVRERCDVVLLTPSTRNHRLYPEPQWTLAWFVPAGTSVGPWGFTCWQPILAFGKDPFLKNRKGSRPAGS
jgi:hypothetical protein